MTRFRSKLYPYRSLSDCWRGGGGKQYTYPRDQDIERRAEIRSNIDYSPKDIRGIACKKQNFRAVSIEFCNAVSIFRTFLSKTPLASPKSDKIFELLYPTQYLSKQMSHRPHGRSNSLSNSNNRTCNDSSEMCNILPNGHDISLDDRQERNKGADKPGNPKKHSIAKDTQTHDCHAEQDADEYSPDGGQVGAHVRRSMRGVVANPIAICSEIAVS